jgi:hypothetical protein
MKGVSTIIATFVLIALTISVATYLTVGFTQLVQKGVSSSSLCAVDTSYVIESAEFNSTGDGVLVVKVTNKGSYGIYGFGLFLLNGTHAKRFGSDDSMADYSGVSEENPLRQERSVLIKANLTGYEMLGLTLSEVMVTNEACPAVSANKKLK